MKLHSKSLANARSEQDQHGAQEAREPMEADTGGGEGGDPPRPWLGAAKMTTGMLTAVDKLLP